MEGIVNFRVLVVDDSASLRQAYALVLEIEGMSVTTASNGREALERVRADKPDLILLDLSMPVMSGWEFRAIQRTDPRLARIPVIVVTAEEIEEAEADLLACHGLVRKPSPCEALITAIRTGLAAARPSDPRAPASYRASCGRAPSPASPARRARAAAGTGRN